MGLRRSTYMTAFDRVNLCQAKWGMKEAREKAAEVLRDAGNRWLILCGAKVARVFGQEPATELLPFRLEPHLPVDPDPDLPLDLSIVRFNIHAGGYLTIP